jgi:hypothetical protein
MPQLQDGENNSYFACARADFASWRFQVVSTGASGHRSVANTESLHDVGGSVECVTAGECWQQKAGVKLAIMSYVEKQ